MFGMSIILDLTKTESVNIFGLRILIVGGLG